MSLVSRVLRVIPPRCEPLRGAGASSTIGPSGPRLVIAAYGTPAAGSERGSRPAGPEGCKDRVEILSTTHREHRGSFVGGDSDRRHFDELRFPDLAYSVRATSDLSEREKARGQSPVVAVATLAQEASPSSPAFTTNSPTSPAFLP